MKSQYQILLCVLIIAGTWLWINHQPEPIPTPTPIPVPRPDPVPNPVPVPIPDQILAKAMQTINTGRVKIQAPAYHLNDKLTAAAQVLADGIEKGTAKPHDGFPDRVWKTGFPHFDLHDPHISFGNISEGVFEGGIDMVGFWVDFLLKERGRETHGGDFREPKFTEIGIGYPKSGHGWTVFDYGTLPP